MTGFLLAVVFTAGVLSIIPHCISSTLQPAAIKSLFILPITDFAPEQAERWQYIIGTLLFPCFLLGLILLCRRFFIGIAQNMNIAVVQSWLLGGLAIAVVAVVSLDIIAMPGSYITSNAFYRHLYLALPAFLVALGLALYAERIANRKDMVKQISGLVVDLVAAVVISAIGLMNIFSASAVNESWVYTRHFNSVFYAMSQVQMGKTLLVDLANQYGLYPHFLEPVFAITGLSVIKFTWLMSMLIAVSLCAIYVFLRRTVSNSWLLLLGFSGVVYFGYLLPKLIMADLDPYFQFHPIRYLFPVLLIVLSSFYFTNRSIALYYGIFILASMSVFWNFDTGLIVFASWLLVLGYQEFTENKPKEALKKAAKHLGIGLGIFIACFVLVFGYLAIRAGAVPDLGLAFAYQGYFLVYGFFMLPMKAIQPWNAVILIYAAGIALSVKNIIRRDSSAEGKSVFLISVLGVGIFSYYQGRSHELNLLTVSYPAVLLAIIAAERLLRAGLRKPRDKILNILAFGAIILVFSSAFFSLIPAARYFYPPIKARISNRAPTQITETTDFIAGQCASGEPVLILSYNSGVYYAESRTVNPLKMPGFTELLLRSDYEALINAIEKRKVKKIFLDAGFLAVNPDYNGRIIAALNGSYKATNTSPSGYTTLYMSSLVSAAAGNVVGGQVLAMIL